MRGGGRTHAPCAGVYWSGEGSIAFWLEPVNSGRSDSLEVLSLFRTTLRGSPCVIHLFCLT